MYARAISAIIGAALGAGTMGCNPTRLVPDAGVTAPTEDGDTADAMTRPPPPPPACPVADDQTSIGSACADGSCADLTCLEAASARVTLVASDSSESVATDLDSFPGSLCTTECTLGGDECGACAACVGERTLGQLIVPYEFIDQGSPDVPNATCRPRCIPSPTGRGDCREGFTCSPEVSACVEACQSDAECKIVDGLAANSEGKLDRFLYNPSSNGVCSETTGRCTFVGNNEDAVAGDTCDENADCGTDGFCDTRVRPEGYCLTLHCALDQFECSGAGETCMLRFPDSPTGLCLKGCVVGAEDPDKRFGPGGSGVGCPPNFSCIWDGAERPRNGLDGVCWIGNYNRVTEPNIGARCTSNTECWSPFGYGECFGWKPDVPGSFGVCSTANCENDEFGEGILPRFYNQSVCPVADGNACLVASSDPLRKNCFRPCAEPGDCDAGLACNRQAFDTPVCFFACHEDIDCNDGRVCRAPAGESDCTERNDCTCVRPTT